MKFNPTTGTEFVHDQVWTREEFIKYHPNIEWLFDPDTGERLHADAPSALDVQVGGGHYKSFAIQPVEFITRNKLGFLEGCVIKRMCRHGAKNGREDLEKAKHEIDLLIQLEHGND